MREQIEVIYENGVLRPIAALSNEFREHQRLTVTIEDSAAPAGWLADADPTISLESVRKALGKQKAPSRKWSMLSAKIADPGGHGG